MSTCSASGACLEWNSESNYQDFAQMQGSWGADGWEFIEGTDDGWSAANEDTDSTTFGARIVSPANDGDSYVLIEETIPTLIDVSTFSTVEARIQIVANDTREVLLYIEDQYDAAFAQSVSNASWVTYTWNISAKSDITADKWIRIYLDGDGGGTVMDADIMRVDYIRIITTNDSSDLQFFEYNTYYRATTEFDLRHSDLEFVIKDDASTKLFEDAIGEFDIEDYFNAEDLRIDIFQYEVGRLDYLFKLQTAGSNGTCWWDYYQAEFNEFSFRRHSTSGDAFNTSSSFAMFLSSSEGSMSAQESFRLTVPEFDACSGILTMDEQTSIPSLGTWWGLIEQNITMTISSVTASSGVLVEEAKIQTDDNIGDYAAGGPYDHRLYVWIDGNAVTNETYSKLIIDQNLAYHNSSQVSFSIWHDKILSILQVQLSYVSVSGESVILAYAAMVDSTQSNEFVIELDYAVSTTGIAAPPIDWLESHLSVTDWMMTQRDFLGWALGMYELLDESGAAPETGLFGILLLPLKVISIAIEGVEDVVKDVLAGTMTLPDIFTTLADIDDILDDFDGYLDGIEDFLDSIDQFLDDIDTALENVPNMVDDIGLYLGHLADLWGVIETFVADVAQAMWERIIVVVWDILDEAISQIVIWVRAFSIEGVTLGEVLDVIDTLTSQFFSTASDLISFATVVLTTWLVVFLMLVWAFIVITSAIEAVNSVRGAGAGFIFAQRVLEKLAAPVTPFEIQVLGTGAKIPWGVILIPYILWVLLDTVDWTALLSVVIL